ncbi:hypothetical protein ACFQH8_13065 [Halomicroarcula sp. GCM10025710]
MGDASPVARWRGGPCSDSGGESGHVFGTPECRDVGRASLEQRGDSVRVVGLGRDKHRQGRIGLADLLEVGQPVPRRRGVGDDDRVDGRVVTDRVDVCYCYDGRPFSDRVECCAEAPDPVAASPTTATCSGSPDSFTLRRYEKRGYESVAVYSRSSTWSATSSGVSPTGTPLFSRAVIFD